MNEIKFKCKCYECPHPCAEWELLSQYIMESYIEENKNKICFINLMKNKSVCTKFLLRHPYIFKEAGNYVSGSCFLSESIISKYSNYIGWNNICKNQKLSENFIRKNIKYIIWDKIILNTLLDENIFEIFSDKINWKLIKNSLSSYFDFSFSENFVSRNISKFDKNNISKICSNYSIEFLIKHKNKLNFNIIIPTRHFKSEEEIFLLEDIIGRHKIIYTKMPSPILIKSFNIDWYYISTDVKLSNKFIIKYFNKLNLFWISGNNKLSCDLIEKLINKISFSNLSAGNYLTNEIFIKYFDKLDIQYLNLENINSEIVKKYFNKIKLKISKNKKLAKISIALSKSLINELDFNFIIKNAYFININSIAYYKCNNENEFIKINNLFLRCNENYYHILCLLWSQNFVIFKSDNIINIIYKYIDEILCNNTYEEELLTKFNYTLLLNRKLLNKYYFHNEKIREGKKILKCFRKYFIDDLIQLIFIFTIG